MDAEACAAALVRCLALEPDHADATSRFGHAYHLSLAQREQTFDWIEQAALAGADLNGDGLVGHSYGGATITAAGVDERVVGLVYVAAVAPDAGETVQNQLDQLDKYPSDIFPRVEVADGRAWMLPNGTEFFAGDLSEEDQKLVWATHYAPVFDLFHQQKLGADRIAWKSKPSWYVLATQDHTLHPDLQRWVSARMKAAVTEVASSHVPMLSQPDVVIDVIRKAAIAVQNGLTTAANHAR